MESKYDIGSGVSRLVRGTVAREVSGPGTIRIWSAFNHTVYKEIEEKVIKVLDPLRETHRYGVTVA